MAAWAAGSSSVRLKPPASASRSASTSFSARSTAALASRDGVRREAGDPRREPVDEGPQLVRGQGAVHPAPALGQLGVDVVAAEHHLHGPRATDEARQPDGARPTGQDAEGHLGLVEHRPPDGREAHVARQRQLAAATADATLDDGDRSPSASCGTARTSRGTRAARSARAGRRGSAGSAPTSKWAMKNSGLADRSTTTRTSSSAASSSAEARHLGVEREVEEVDRRVVEGDGGDAGRQLHPQRRVVVVGHGRTLAASRPCVNPNRPRAGAASPSCPAVRPARPGRAGRRSSSRGRRRA